MAVTDQDFAEIRELLAQHPPRTYPAKLLAGAVAWPPGVTMPATVTALNTLYRGSPPNGAPGYIRVGTSPYDYVALAYDSDLGKWVEEDADLLCSVLTASVTSGTAYSVKVAGPLMRHKLFTDAGLVLNVKVEVLASAGASSSIQIACLATTANAGGASSLDITNVSAAVTTSATSETMLESDWAALNASVTPKDYVALSLGTRRTGTNNGTAGVGAALWMRWTS